MVDLGAAAVARLPASPDDYNKVRAAVLDHDTRLGTAESGLAVLQAYGEAGVSNPATTSGSDTTTSATNVNLAGTGAVTSFSFTKGNTGTRVRLTLEAAAWVATAAATVGRFAMRINSVDYDVASYSPEAVSARRQVSGFAYVPAGLAAGVYTVQARWRRVSGTGTLTRDSNDWLAISAEEVP